jgi:hypothetical protein
LKLRPTETYARFALSPTVWLEIIIISRVDFTHHVTAVSHRSFVYVLTFYAVSDCVLSHTPT